MQKNNQDYELINDVEGVVHYVPKKHINNNTKNTRTGCYYSMIVLSVLFPVFSIIGNKIINRQVKNHPNIIKTVTQEYILICDIKDQEDRIVSTGVLGRDSVNALLFQPGDTIYFYDKNYYKTDIFASGRILYNKDIIRKRKNSLKMQNER